MYKISLLTLLLFIFVSCKDENVDSKEIIISASSGDLVSYKLSNVFQTEGGYKITQQAKSSVQSEILYNKESGFLEYNYQSKEGFSGTEKVKIKLESSIGDGELYTVESLLFTIQVK